MRSFVRQHEVEPTYSESGWRFYSKTKKGKWLGPLCFYYGDPIPSYLYPTVDCPTQNIGDRSSGLREEYWKAWLESHKTQPNTT